MCTHLGEVASLAFSRDGKRIVGGNDNMLVKIFNAETGAEVSSFSGERFGW